MASTDPADRFRFRWAVLPAVTADLPGTGGVIRQRPGDFLVREVPLYLPSGQGSHVYVLVEKTGLTTRDLVVALMRSGVAERSIGVAGLKDKAAVTQQWLSIPSRHAEAVSALETLEGVRVLEVSRHKNKLGIGHLLGNRFDIRVRDVEAGAASKAAAIVARLQAQGVPNYFGPQRFGRFGSNALDGLKVIRGERVPGGRRLQRFFLSALQSQLFNHLLATRIGDGLFDRVVTGDWAKKHDTGGVFLVEDGDRESPRAARLELSATLPLYGKKVGLSLGKAGELELATLEHFGLRWQDFTARRGSRRFSRIILEEVKLKATEDGYLLSFMLPKGAFATGVLREVMKVEVDTLTDEALDEEA